MPDFALGLPCERLLGEGTSGSVWAVASSVDGNNYAVKRITLAEVPQTLEQALSECRLHSRLVCPSVAGYQYSWIENDEESKPRQLCILLERLDGELYDALLSQPPSHTERHAWSLQMLEAVAAVHKAGIVHRDISPWNVFVRDGAPRDEQVTPNSRAPRDACPQAGRRRFCCRSNHAAAARASPTDRGLCGGSLGWLATAVECSAAWNAMASLRWINRRWARSTRRPSWARRTAMAT
eukprot:5033453-Prymnesium_polylepis.1